jgi:hypothetical protein
MKTVTARIPVSRVPLYFLYQGANCLSITQANLRPSLLADREVPWLHFAERVIWYVMGPLQPHRYHCDWDSLLELVDQDWLRRSWTFQESAPASNPVLVFGQEHVTWREWQQAIA